MSPVEHWDVIVVGGGPAGLSGALLLARACRRVLLIDAGEPRNSVSRHAHGFLSRDGVSPDDLLAIARAQLLAYPGVRHCKGRVIDCEAIPASSGFRITTETGATATCDAVLLAQGIKDVLPDIRGIEVLYGRCVHHCPYCDAWEHRGKRLVVYGSTSQAVGVACALRGWSLQVTLVPGFGLEVDGVSIHQLEKTGVRLLQFNPLEVRMTSDNDGLLICEGGETVPFDALFFVTQETRSLTLLRALGCRLNGDYPELSAAMQTSVSGVFVAGNACGGHDMIAMAVAEGANAAIGINEYLLDRGRFYQPEVTPSSQ